MIAKSIHCGFSDSVETVQPCAAFLPAEPCGWLYRCRHPEKMSASRLTSSCRPSSPAGKICGCRECLPSLDPLGEAELLPMRMMCVLECSLDAVFGLGLDHPEHGVFAQRVLAWVFIIPRFLDHSMAAHLLSPQSTD